MSWSPVRERVSDREGRASLVASRPATGTDVERWTGQLLLSAASQVTEDDARERASRFDDPIELDIEVGSVPEGDAYADLNDGFDATAGCYILEPDQGQVRFILDGRHHPIFSPAFKIKATHDQLGWVYVDHLILDRTARDREGNLVFQVPDAVRERRIVEVLLRRASSVPGA